MLVGIICSFIYDLFRAVRKNKNTGKKRVLLQDIMYLLIVAVIFLVVICKYMHSSIRVYLILSSILGGFIYFGIIGDKILKILVKILNITDGLKHFIMSPIYILSEISKVFFEKIVKKCCKKILYMITYFKRYIGVILNRKRVLYGTKRKEHAKKGV